MTVIEDRDKRNIELSEVLSFYRFSIYRFIFFLYFIS